MKERPILFSTPMVQGLLNTKPGTWPPEPIDPRKPCKGMTRRVVKQYGRTPEQCGRDKFYKHVNELNGKQGLHAGFYKDSDVFMYEGKQLIDAIYFKSRYQPGDVIYVQETWKCTSFSDKTHALAIHFKNGGQTEAWFDSKERYEKFKKFYFKNGWQSPYFMPKEAARLFLVVKEVRVERLQDISEEDAKAEGVIPHPIPSRGFVNGHRNSFERLWDSINGEKYPWQSSPWVWVYSLERTDKPEATS